MVVKIALFLCVIFWKIARIFEPSLTFKATQAVLVYEAHLEHLEFIAFLKKAGWSWSDWIELKEMGERRIEDGR